MILYAVTAGNVTPPFALCTTPEAAEAARRLHQFTTPYRQPSGYGWTTLNPCRITEVFVGSVPPWVRGPAPRELTDAERGEFLAAPLRGMTYEQLSRIEAAAEYSRAISRDWENRR